MHTLFVISNALLEWAGAEAKINTSEMKQAPTKSHVAIWHYRMQQKIKAAFFGRMQSETFASWFLLLQFCLFQLFTCEWITWPAKAVSAPFSQHLQDDVADPHLLPWL